MPATAAPTAQLVVLIDLFPRASPESPARNIFHLDVFPGSFARVRPRA